MAVQKNSRDSVLCTQAITDYWNSYTWIKTINCVCAEFNGKNALFYFQLARSLWLWKSCQNINKCEKSLTKGGYKDYTRIGCKEKLDMDKYGY